MHLVDITVTIDEAQPTKVGQVAPEPRYIRVKYSHPRQYPVTNQVEINPMWSMMEVIAQAHNLIYATWSMWFMRTTAEACKPEREWEEDTRAEKTPTKRHVPPTKTPVFTTSKIEDVEDSGGPYE